MLTYLMCPRQFKFKYIQYLPQKKNKYMKAGIEVHDILDKFFDKIDIYKPDFFGTMKQVAGDMYLEHQQYLDNFIKYESQRWESLKNKMWYKPMRKEKKIFEKDFNAIIDRVDYIPDNGFFLIDYKTGNFYKKKWEEARFELTFYAYLFARKYHRPIWKIGIMALKTGKMFEEELTKAHYDEMFRIVEWVKKRIENQEYHPKPGSMCYWCDYREICEELRKSKKKKDLFDDWEIDK